MNYKLALLSVMVAGCAADRCVSDLDGNVKIRVACIGDSITWGYAMTNRVEECYPACLQRLLGDGYEVRNFGDSGAGVYRNPKRGASGWRPHPWSEMQWDAAHAFNPDIIVSGLGINDAEIYMDEYVRDEKGVPKTEPGLFRRQYIELLKSFEREGRRPQYFVWTRLAPVGKGHRLKGTPNASVMERDLESVAKAVGATALDIYAPLVPYAETEHFAADGIHPEGGAQKVIAEETSRVLNARWSKCGETPSR